MNGKFLPQFRTTPRLTDTAVVVEGEATVAASIAAASDAVRTLSMTRTCGRLLLLVATLTLG